MALELTILRLVHILLGMFWVGTTVFTAAFLLPTLSEAGPAAPAIMAGLQKRRLMVFLPIAALLTLLSGLRLLWLMSGGFAPAYFATRRGLIFSVAGGLAIVAFAIGLTVNRPAMAKAGALGARLAGGESTDRERILVEIQALRKRAGIAGMVVTILLVLATAGMAVARYL